MSILYVKKPYDKLSYVANMLNKRLKYIQCTCDSGDLRCCPDQTYFHPLEERETLLSLSKDDSDSFFLYNVAICTGGLRIKDLYVGDTVRFV